MAFIPYQGNHLFIILKFQELPKYKNFRDGIIDMYFYLILWFYYGELNMSAHNVVLQSLF